MSSSLRSFFGLVVEGGEGLKGVGRGLFEMGRI